MELYTLRYVLAVADSGNFSLAAQACHVGQPALSQQIAKLEKELGVALFARNPRGATLTEAGKDFVLRAREILQRAQALQAEMSFYAGLRKGSLNLGIITSLQCINFGGMLSAFCGSYPDISVNIVQEGTHRLLDLLLDFIQDEQHSVLMSSHITSDLEQVADAIAYLHHGQLLFCENKDDLLQEYGLLHCAEADLARLPEGCAIYTRRGAFGCETLVKDRTAAHTALPDAVCDSASIDDIMRFYSGRDAQ